MKTRNMLLIILLVIYVPIWAKGKAVISGYIKDLYLSKPINGITITLIGDKLIYQCLSDSNGFYQFKNIPKGQYKLILQDENYSKEYRENVQITDKTSFSEQSFNLIPYLTDVLSNSRSHFGCGYVVYYSEIESSNIIKLLRKVPNQNINMIAAYVRGVDSRNGETPIIRGSRPEGTAYYIDGVRIANPNTGEVVIGKQ